MDIKAFGLLFTIILGIILPFGKNLDFLLMPLLIFLLFSSFLKIDFKEKKIYLVSILKVLVSILLMGGISFYIGILLNMPLSWHIGFVLAALTPTAVSSPIIVGFLKGNILLTVQCIFLTNFGVIFYLPILMFFFFKKEVEIDPFLMSEKIFLLIIIPFILAMFVKKMQFKKYFDRALVYATFPLLCFTIWIIISRSSDLIQSMFFENRVLFLAVFLLAITNYLFGYLITTKEKMTLSIAVGHKNTLTSIWIALVFFDPIVAIVPTIYIICHHFINSLLLAFYAKKEVKKMDYDF